MERKIVITFDEESEFPYNAQVWSFINGKWWYTGYGVFCRTLQEALEHANKRNLPVEFN